MLLKLEGQKRKKNNFGYPSLVSLYFLKAISGCSSLPTHCHNKHNHFVPSKVISGSLLNFDFVLNESLFASNRVKYLEGLLGGQVVEGGIGKKQVSQFSIFYVLKIHLGIKMCKYRFFRPRPYRGTLKHPKDQLALPLGPTGYS